MTLDELSREIFRKASYLCVGLDTDYSRIPEHLKHEKDPVFAFNKQIIDAVGDYCVAFKPNIAFYESLGPSGWESLEKTLDYIPDEFFTIADAKRGDIGNSSRLYARTFFETLDFDAVTVQPYMGGDAVAPFLEYENKYTILLALTSNPGSEDFQTLPLYEESMDLYEKVVQVSSHWPGAERLMYVVGATRFSLLATVRSLVPEHFILVPGVGSQGGDLYETSKNGLNQRGGLLVNSSRSILYASSGKDFADAAAGEAKNLAQEMRTYLQEFQVL